MDAALLLSLSFSLWACRPPPPPTPRDNLPPSPLLIDIRAQSELYLPGSVAEQDAGCFSTKANIARERIYRFKKNNLINSAGFP